MRNSHVNSSLGSIVKQIEDDIANNRPSNPRGFMTASQMLKNNREEEVAEKTAKKTSINRKLQSPFSFKKDPLTQTSVSSFFKVESSKPVKAVHDISPSGSENEEEGWDEKSGEEDVSPRLGRFEVSSDPPIFQKASDIFGREETPSAFCLASEMKAIMEERKRREREAESCRKGSTESNESPMCTESEEKVCPETNVVMKAEIPTESEIDPLRRRRVSHFNKGSENRSSEKKVTLGELWGMTKLDSVEEKSEPVGKCEEEKKIENERKPAVICREEKKVESENKLPVENGVVKREGKITPQKRKINDLFGDSGSDSEGEKRVPPKRSLHTPKDKPAKKVVKSGNNQELKQMADLVVKLLMPYYKEQRIASRDLFKSLARSLAHEASKITSSSGESRNSSLDAFAF